MEKPLLPPPEPVPRSWQMPELTWQEETGQYYGELQTEEGLKRVWMEEETSLGLKMDLIRQNELAGVACWKLGFEPASVWDVIGGNE